MTPEESVFYYFAAMPFHFLFWFIFFLIAEKNKEKFMVEAVFLFIYTTIWPIYTIIMSAFVLFLTVIKLSEVIHSKYHGNSNEV